MRRFPRLRIGNSVWALGNTLASLLSSMLGFVVVSNVAGTDRLGVLALVGASLFPLRFADLGLSGAVTRYIGAYQGAHARKYLFEVVGLGAAISFVAFTILLAACAVASPPLMRATIGGNEMAEARNLAWFLITLTGTQLLNGLLTSSLLGLQRFRTVYATGIATNALQLILMPFLVMRFGVAGMITAQIVAQLCNSMVFILPLACVRNAAGAASHPESGLDRMAFLRFTTQFSLNSLLSSMLEPAAKLVIGRNAPLVIMGVFEVLWRIFVQARTLLVAPLNPIGIMLIRQYQEDPQSVHAKYCRIFLFCAGCSLLLLMASAPVYVAFGVFTHNIGRDSAVVAGTIGLVTAVAFLSVPVYFLSLAANRVLPIIINTLTNLAVVLVVGLPVGYFWGWEAVMVAFLCAHTAGVIAHYVAAAKWLGFRVIPSRAELACALANARGELAAIVGRGGPARY